MNFPDYRKMKGNKSSTATHQQILSYLQNYAQYFQLYPYIQVIKNYLLVNFKHFDKGYTFVPKPKKYLRIFMIHNKFLRSNERNIVVKINIYYKDLFKVHLNSLKKL